MFYQIMLYFIYIYLISNTPNLFAFIYKKDLEEYLKIQYIFKKYIKKSKLEKNI